MASFTGERLLGSDFTVEVATTLFFNEGTVAQAVDRGKKGALSKIGAFIRRGAKSLLRYGKGNSEPGQPPTVHKSAPIKKIKYKKINGKSTPISSKVQALSPLREFLFFVYDASTQSVVIGPAKTNQVHFEAGPTGKPRPVTGTVPSVLEFGGTVTKMEVQGAGGGWRRADLRSRRRLAGSRIRFRRSTYEPRPYMGPAFRQELSNPRLMQAWKDAIGVNVSISGGGFSDAAAA